MKGRFCNSGRATAVVTVLVVIVAIVMAAVAAVSSRYYIGSSGNISSSISMYCNSVPGTGRPYLFPLLHI
jgi:hypothetical protein